MKFKKSTLLSLSLTGILTLGLAWFTVESNSSVAANQSTADSLSTEIKNSNVASKISKAKSKLSTSEIHDKNKLKEILRMKIDELNGDDNQTITNTLQEAKITKEQALESVLSEVQESTVSQATKIHVTKHVMTYEHFGMFSSEALEANPKLKSKGYIDKLPIWLVSFEGLELAAHGSATFKNKEKELKANTEVVFVVDATSGKRLFSFRYR